MDIITRKCEYCGNEYHPSNKRQRFCSDLCRMRSFRKAQQNERKEAVKVYKDRIAKPKQVKHQGISEQDPRSKVAKLKAKGIRSLEYWRAFQECDLQYYEGGTSVNGISTQLPFFAEGVLLSIEEQERVAITATGKNSSGEDDKI